jgi:hypothetical protein
MPILTEAEKSARHFRDTSIWTRPANDWKTRLARVVQYVGGGAIVALAMTFYVEINGTMPDYAGVYLDEAAKAYIPLPCYADWERAPTDRYAVVHLSTAGDARRSGYGMDDACNGKGYISGTSHSLLIAWLIGAGALPADVEWWDRPYRTENGVVYPKHLSATGAK